jgi:hypothetical protein
LALHPDLALFGGRNLVWNLILEQLKGDSNSILAWKNQFYGLD